MPVASVRLSISVSSHLRYSSSFDDQLALYRESGFRLIDLSYGISWINKNDIYPRNPTQAMRAIDFASSKKDGCTYIINGQITGEMIASHSSYNIIFGCGRSLIADPQYFRKIRLGDYEKIHRCRLSGHCHYYTRNKAGIECPISKFPWQH